MAKQSRKKTSGLLIVHSIIVKSFVLCVSHQEAAQALIYAGMAGSKLESIQEKVNEYLNRVQALHNAGESSTARQERAGSIVPPHTQLMCSPRETFSVIT